MTLSFINLLTVTVALSAQAQSASPARDTGSIRSATAAVPRLAVPFAVGERATYDVKFGAVKVGDGRMEVLGIEDVRGRDAWRTVFTVKGGTFFYKVNDRYESWIDTETFESLRFVQDLEEGGRDRERHFEIYPERAIFVQREKGEVEPSVQDPLDEGSFLYFVRTVPLEVGQTYQFHRYFKTDRNPVIIRVLRRERVRVPAGVFDAIVVQPIIKTKGIFSEGGQAQVWFSDDDRRILLQVKSKLKFGSLNLYLKSYRQTATSASTNR
ncbi:MAG: DUF3108 domain-containing protein [Chloroflexota bacterium]|nr:DUF3108 domain-containing protein [Chloroflexota bacterium]